MDCPPEMGLSYPANAYWRYWALAKFGHTNIIVSDWRTKWATMASVIENNSLQENWIAKPDSMDEWSHCPVCPLYLLYMDIAGIRPTAPGFEEFVVRPQLGDIGNLELTAYTVRGPIHFKAERTGNEYQVTVEIPSGARGELLLPKGVKSELEPFEPDHPLGLARYEMKQTSTFTLPAD